MLELIKKAKSKLFWSYMVLLTKIKKKAWIDNRGGQRFSIKISSVNELLRALTFHEKEPETLNWINGFGLRSNDFVFFDVGANIGIYSLYAASIYSKAKVFSFEPDSQSFGSLCANIYQNSFNATPFPIAISSGTGMGLLHSSLMVAGAGACALGGDYKFYDGDGGAVFKQGVFFVSLDDFVFVYGNPCPNYVKIDVDGIEFEILRGGTRVLRSNECVGVLVEIQYELESEVEKISNYMKEFDFLLTEKSNWISGYGKVKSRNYIFTKNGDALNSHLAALV